MNDSKYRDPMLTNTPVLSNLIDDTVVMIKDFEILKSDYSKNKDVHEFNREALDLF